MWRHSHLESVTSVVHQTNPLLRVWFEKEWELNNVEFSSCCEAPQLRSSHAYRFKSLKAKPGILTDNRFLFGVTQILPSSSSSWILSKLSVLPTFFLKFGFFSFGYLRAPSGLISQFEIAWNVLQVTPLSTISSLGSFQHWARPSEGGQASTKMFSIRPMGCLSSNQEAVLIAEMRGHESLSEGKQIERKVEKRQKRQIVLT